ncbi:hypothetical protein K439DRAFT_1665827 [Ramaria rubella]|nr:hypothetical protein K439DRAFT_1665827 [Ramaria rubella]
MIVDYSELADTGYVPTAFEYSQHIRVGAEEQRHELASVDEEIATLENRLSHLRASKIKLWRSCTSSAGLMAPIRRLPPEILGYIFVMSRPSISWQDLGVDPYQAHSAIQSVCRYLSAVLDETPRMWSTIIIRDPLLKIAQIEKMIHRSKSCLLDVYLGANEQQINSIVERNAARLRLLSVDFPAHGHVFQNHITVELPNLQCLSIPLDCSPVRLPQIIQASKLSSLRICRDAIDSFKDSFSTLRSLVFVNVAFTRSLATVPEFEILKHCPNLQFLEWRDYKETHQMTNDTSQMETIHLPLLEVLKVTLSNSLPAQGIFLCPCAPKLQSFTLSSPPENREWTPIALRLPLRMEASQLCRLSLHGIRCADDYEFDSLLNYFPSLTTLCLDRCTIGPIFFPSSIDDPILYRGPGLKTLHLRCTTFSASNLATFVRSHTVPNSMRTLRTHSAGLQQVLIEQWRHVLIKEEIQQLLSLHEEYGEVVVTRTIDRSNLLKHDCLLDFHETMHIQRTTCGDHAMPIEEDIRIIIRPRRFFTRGWARVPKNHRKG